MKKVIHATVLSAFLLASTHSMAASYQVNPVIQQEISQQDKQELQQALQQAQDQYAKLRAENNMTAQQAQEVEAGFIPAPVVWAAVRFLVQRYGPKAAEMAAKYFTREMAKKVIENINNQ